MFHKITARERIKPGSKKCTRQTRNRAAAPGAKKSILKVYLIGSKTEPKDGGGAARCCPASRPATGPYRGPPAMVPDHITIK